MIPSPSDLSNGRTPTPNGGPPQFVRKPKPADPLRPRKRPVRRPDLPAGAPRPLLNKDNGPTPIRRQSPAKQFAPPQMAAPRAPVIKNENNGWTHPPPPPGQYMDYPLFTTKKALREGLRYHVARFTSKREVDPTDQNTFTRPVSLHRRDPRQPIKGEKDNEPEDVLDSKEREKKEIEKAEAEARKAANQAQIAPTGKATAVKKFGPARHEKTEQVWRLDKTEADKRESDLRYEEALPWHLEDADNKNTWVGNYEAALSDTNVAFVIEGSRFMMIPLEKWYKFSAKNQFKGFSIEEAEARYNKKVKESRWVMKTQEKEQERMAAAETRRQLGGLFMVKAESKTFKNAGKSETQDADDLDFNDDDLFQDDDEQATVEPDKDEDAKESKDRIKREQLGANIFDQTNEADVDKELEEEEKEAERRKKLGKGVKKALTKREKMTIYESDTSNPYASSSEDDTSDEEKQKEIDKRKDEEAKAKAKAESKLPSGTSTKGSNTPSGRPKHTDPMKKSKSLKRSGSPNPSESSGNESSRKKQKKKHSSQPTGTSTPIPGSRPMSPAPSSSAPVPGQSPRKSSIIKLNLNPSKLSEIQSAPPNPDSGSAMSDGEATGGEMSDGGKKKKIKLRLGGASSANSRAGSPAPGNRASSPGQASGKIRRLSFPSRVSSPGAGPIQSWEVAAALPKSGISAASLIKLFPGRIGGIKGQQTDKKDFMRMVKENSVYGTDKLLRPK